MDQGLPVGPQAAEQSLNPAVREATDVPGRRV